jgi:lysophospholipid acyltransferase (LPLAT)-like uncharacterized protein
LSAFGAGYLRFVWRTTPFVIEPADIYEQIDPRTPVILAVWHGQHFLLPFVKRHYRAKAMVTRHRDGDIFAMTAERLGIVTVRGSGDTGGRFDRKGGVGAFAEMVESLRQGWNVALTADVPKIARVAGRGIVMMARNSGRPIYPVAIATSRRIQLKNWDRTTVHLPFGRGAVVATDPIYVSETARDDELEAARVAVQAGLNAATHRANELVGRRE